MAETCQCSGSWTCCGVHRHLATSPEKNYNSGYFLKVIDPSDQSAAAILSWLVLLYVKVEDNRGPLELLSSAPQSFIPKPSPTGERRHSGLQLSTVRNAVLHSNNTQIIQYLLPLVKHCISSFLINLAIVFPLNFPPWLLPHPSLAPPPPSSQHLHGPSNSFY